MADPITGTGGVTLAVHDEGSSALPAAVIAHGVGSSPRFIREAFAAPLAMLGYRLIAYDLRGHGESTALADPAAHRLESHIADLDAVVAVVDGRLVGGVSLGGHIAAAWASGRQDVDGLLVCLPAWSGRATRGAGPHAAVASEVAEVGIAGVLARIRDDAGVPPWLREVLDRDWRTHDADSLAAALTALDGADAPTGASLGRITVPTGLVAWPDDPGHPVEVAAAWAAVIPRSVLETTTLAAVGEGRTALGAAAVRAYLGASALDQDGLGGP